MIQRKYIYIDMNTDRKFIVVTGAGSGIGHATATLFIEKGWFVGGYDIDGAGLDILSKKYGPDNCVVETLDVTNISDFRSALRRFCGKSNGKLDVLYNNAGVLEITPFANMEFETIVRQINVNLIGVIAGIYEGLPFLKSTDNSLCFTTSSSTAIVGAPGAAIYSATKHAVKGLTESLSVEFAEFGIRVADVLPGQVDTDLLPQRMKKSAPKDGMWRLIPPKVVAETVWRAYHSDRLHWYVPKELVAFEREVVENRELENFRTPPWLIFLNRILKKVLK